MNRIDWDDSEWVGDDQNAHAQINARVQRLLGNLGIDKKAIAAARIADVWNKVAPELVKQHTCEVYNEIRNGQRVLIVQVDDSMLASDLSAQPYLYLVKVNKALKQEYGVEHGFDGVRFTVSSWSARRKRCVAQCSQPPSYEEPAPAVALSDDEERAIESAAASIEDEKLRIAIENAMKSNISWKKGIETVKGR